MAAGDALGTAISGLLANQRALATVSHNIANVNTPGYSRQRVLMSTRPPQASGAGFIGSGVTITAVERVFEQFTVDQVRSNTSLNSQFQTYYTLAAQVDTLLADPNAGLSPSLQRFFDSLQNVADDPASLPARQVFLTEAEALRDRFQSLYDRFDQVKTGVNNQITATVDAINGMASAIADVNTNIVRSLGLSGGKPASDLLDQRDELIRQLSELIDVSVIEQDTGAVNVFVGNGIGVVIGPQATQLAVVNDQYDVLQKGVGLVTNTGTFNITGNISGGIIGGTLEFRDQILDPTFNIIGRVAIVLEETFNNQHELGQDLNNQLGAGFFNDLNTTQFSRARAINSSFNGGNAIVDVTITDVSALTTSDYVLQRTSTNYVLTRLSDNTSTTLATFPGTPEAVDGITFTLASGAMAVNDTLLIRPTRTGAADIDLNVTEARRIAASLPVRSQANFNNIGNAEISQPTVNGPAPPNPNLQQAVTFTFNSPATTYNVVGVGTGNPVNVAYTDGGSITYNGFTLQISGTPQPGDSFTIGPNTDGVSDNRNALLLADLQIQNILDGGAVNLQSSYGQGVSRVGTLTRQADVNRQAQEVLLDQAVAAREAISGVNLDEEAANLLRFQQAYAAAAQVITIADTMFQTLLAAVRR